ncbi:MAG TPA: deoxynucleoside kinase [Bacteroidales bacterium]|nr:deoxynucleoside kinase [Bacteroidales bacterium]HPS62056.1 deoxynucleoside kinase [Bacteroidales bacterium]
MYNYIVIEGNIGAGKTSFATMLAEESNARLVLEQFEENSFLPRFYEDPVRYAFPLELSFLADRYQQLKSLFSASDLFRSFTVADYFIFKSLIFASKNLEPLEFGLYSKLFAIVSSVVPKPDMIVYLYLNLANLKKNIEKRGRPYEQNIQFDYLEKIQKGYLDFLRQQPDLRVLVIDTNGLDFVLRREDYLWLKDVILSEYPAGMHHISNPYLNL